MERQIKNMHENSVYYVYIYLPRSVKSDKNGKEASEETEGKSNRMRWQSKQWNGNIT